MIARLWHGATPAAMGEDYADYMGATGFAELRATEGNLGVFMLRRRRGDRAEFIMLSLWESEEAIRSFAGDDLQVARYYPRDAEFLLDLEPRSEHWEVVRCEESPR